MLTEKRQEEITAFVNEKGSVTLQELVERFHASESTIRRDITALAQEGRLRKVFGGALAGGELVSHTELSVSQKEGVDTQEKLRIARYAASLIMPDDFVYLDAGTTTGSMIDYIQEKRATYLTNAVAHARRLACRGLHVLLVGGELKGSTEAIVGAEAIDCIRKYHFSKGFFGTNSIHPQIGFTTPDINEALLKQAALCNTQSGCRFILSAYRKFGQVSSVTFSNGEGVVILTDRMPDGEEWKNYTIKVSE